RRRRWQSWALLGGPASSGDCARRGSGRRRGLNLMTVTGREATARRSGHLALFEQRPSGPDELRVLRRRDWAAVGIVAAVVIGIALRFLSRGPLWLDEAQSLPLARHPLPH